VLDLRKRLSLTVAAQTKDSRVVVIDIAAGEVGVIVDAVSEVLRIPDSSVEPPSAMITQSNTDYLMGIAKLKDRLIILLDLNKLLSTGMDGVSLAELIKNDTILAEKEPELAAATV
jgi:purine-binding chemotaxis protein CheW